MKKHLIIAIITGFAVVPSVFAAEHKSASNYTLGSTQCSNDVVRYESVDSSHQNTPRKGAAVRATSNNTPQRR